MAGDEGRSGAEHEKAQETEQAGDQTGRRQTEDDGQQGTQHQQSPPLPLSALPPPHQASLKSQPGQQPQSVHFVPLPAAYAPYAQAPPVPAEPERPFFPRWHRAKLALGASSLVTCVVIFGIGIALGYDSIRYRGYSAADAEFGVSAAAAGLALLVTTAEFMKICLSSRGRGMSPGAHVAFHLIIWLMALIAIVATALYYSNEAGYYDSEGAHYSSAGPIYEQVLIAFDSLLFVIHFVLFVGACVETNRFERTRRKTKNIIITVPADYPNGPYTFYGSPQSFGLQPVAHGQHPLPVICPVPPQPGVLYGGYYAPPPAALAPMSSQQQANPGLIHGYYAPTTAPAAILSTGAPAQSSRQNPSAAAAASGSGSRRSQPQSHSQTQPST